MVKCDKSYDESGQCCCNCEHQKRLMCHPSNVKVGKGSIMSQMAWACVVMFGDKSNEGNYIFRDNKHGMCELWIKRK